jgi:hypothetical protein
LKATSNNLEFLLRTVFAAAGGVSEVRRILFNTARFRSLAIHPQILVFATKPVVGGGLNQGRPGRWKTDVALVRRKPFPGGLHQWCFYRANFA